MFDVIIIGAGVVGGMIARELSRYCCSVCLLEKGNDVAVGASKANSGIIHGGYDPLPGTLKAKLNTLGVPLLYEAAEQLQVPYVQNGSLVCAFDQLQAQTVRKLYQRGLDNGIARLELLTGPQVRRLEPALSDRVVLALRVPTAGIICPYSLTIAAVGNAMDNGVILKRNFKVTNMTRLPDGFAVTDQRGNQVTGKVVVNAAGCYSDAIARLAGDDFFTVLPRAGEYLLLDKTEGNAVSHTIFQVPTKEGKGILVTPTAHGNLLCGPTAGVVESPEDTRITPMGIQRVQELARQSVPGVDFGKVITSFTGVRSSVEQGDFIVCASQRVPGLLHAAAIDSPGLTCSVAIAKRVTALVAEQGIALTEKPEFNPYREDTHAFAKMSIEEKNQYIQQHPDYGQMVCRCEQVTKGEILDALRRNPAALDLDGIKRRTRSGMGRCQGGFCGPHIMEILAAEQQIAMEQVTKKGEDSRMLTGRL